LGIKTFGGNNGIKNWFPQGYKVFIGFEGIQEYIDAKEISGGVLCGNELATHHVRDRVTARVKVSSDRV